MIRILIVDDDVKILDSLKRIFDAKTNYKVIITEDPEEAYRIVGDEKIDIVITDLVMPKIFGTELIKMIKKRNGMIEIIAMTAHTKLEYVTSALRRGASEIFLKPFDDVQELIDCVDDFVNRINRWKKIIVEISNKK